MKGITLTHLRILRIDPDPDFIESMRYHLERSKRKIYTDTAHTPEEAVEKLGRNRYDAVVSEYDLGETNAIKLLEQVKEETDIPFFIHSRFYSSHLEEKAEKKGAAAFLRKKDDDQYYLDLLDRLEDHVRMDTGADISFQPDIMCVFDSEGELVKYNPAFLDALGTENQDLKPWQVFKDKKEEEFQEIMIEMETSEKVETEGAIVTSGGLTNYDLNIDRIQNGQEVLVGIFGTSRERLDFMDPEERVINRVESKKESEIAG